jgi:Family of unknown function (DUF6282)
VARTPPSDRRTIPSERARELVRGGYDLHVHVAPDLIPRRIDDVGLAARCSEVGLAGFVLKSHYQVTAERAAVVARVVPGVDVVGAITLNSSVGGLSALAVEIAARSGARFVWMPTFDAANETAGRGNPEPGTKLPVWAKLQVALRMDGVETPAITVLDELGRLRPETREVIETAARHQLVLATGHLARDEIFAVVTMARELGLERIVVTHPDFPSQDLTPEDQCALADLGALLERCFATAHAGRVSWARVLSNIRYVGPERSFISSDLGQVDNPSVEDGLALFADRLLDAGFTAEEIRTMAVANTRHLAAPARAVAT